MSNNLYIQSGGGDINDIRNILDEIPCSYKIKENITKSMIIGRNKVLKDLDNMYIPYIELNGDNNIINENKKYTIDINSRF